jgi:LysR family glycine cleavage system transcriptional activator
MYFEDLSIIYECAVQGIGIALGQLRYLERELAAGQLIAPHSFVLRRRLGYYLVCPLNQATDSKVSSLRNWLLDKAATPHQHGQGPTYSGRQDPGLTQKSITGV